MAKVKGPLFSLGARGQIAKTLVYGDWKGIDWVRQHVIPANPKSEDQKKQRGYFGDAVEKWHTLGYVADDVKAWNLLALVIKEALSGFNVFVRLYTKAMIAIKTWTVLKYLTVQTVEATAIHIHIQCAEDKEAQLYYGVSKTSMFDKADMTFETDYWNIDMTGLVESTVYYFYVINEAVGEVARTGIYSQKTAAA